MDMEYFTIEIWLKGSKQEQLHFHTLANAVEYMLAHLPERTDTLNRYQGDEVVEELGYSFNESKHTFTHDYINQRNEVRHVPVAFVWTKTIKFMD